MSAAVATRNEQLMMWLHSLGVSPNVPNREKLYPIHILAKQGYLEPMKLMTDVRTSRCISCTLSPRGNSSDRLASHQTIKADIHVRDSTGRTALDTANEHNMNEVVLFLYERGVDPIFKKSTSTPRHHLPSSSFFLIFVLY